ncbi:MAG: methyltransferase domain-containing protein [Planctomycetaceae bacterium]|nr:methyltransferase domain-containing protein [Planctomycetaceae bacterium]
MLHIAPEPILSQIFNRADFIEYLSADLSNPNAMVNFDLTDIPYADNSFDVIYCSHVLEHIPDDRQAMRELRRVMTPNGWAILLVPITAEKTFEDSSVTSPEERERLFGQHDHVRRYGPDYVNRLQECGFRVSVETIPEQHDEQQRDYFGLRWNHKIYFCQKGDVI